MSQEYRSRNENSSLRDANPVSHGRHAAECKICLHRDAILHLVDSIYKGSIGPRVGTALTPLLNLQLEGLELYELEQRVTRLEGENLPANN